MSLPVRDPSLSRAGRDMAEAYVTNS